MSDIQAFDRAWRAKLTRELNRAVGSEARRQVMFGEEALDAQGDVESIYAWTVNMLRRLEERVPEAARKGVLNACGCWMGKEDLSDLRTLYEATHDLDLILQRAGVGLISYLRDSRGVSQAVIDEVTRRGWGWPGRRDGDTIRVTKIPFEGTIEEFFAEPDPAKRRALNYCHCPRVRDILKTGKRLSTTYCHCSAGFYKKNFEEILQCPVDVEIVQTVLSGDEVCSFAIHLPAGV
ncbi:MAG: DUF6144 family protein [Candidatus Bipolaricaulis sp.]|nr:DUF6144 family protein [Candidatus Bipolaricaulis sp.]